MRSPLSRAVSRGLFRIGIVMLSQAGWLASADDGSTANRRLVQNRIPTAPAFEEDTQSGSARRYLWHNRDIEAKLDIGSGISFRFPDGRELGITFAGAKPGIKPHGESASFPVYYYLGPSRYWHSSIRWERVRYPDIYPGIDLVFVTNAGQLEFNFEIRPEADPGKIKIRYHGAAVQLNQNGDLVIGTGRKQIQQHRAFAFQGAFQGVSVENRIVQCSYHLEHGSLTLRLGLYDLRRTLIIDPVLNFSTYLGGPGYDAINALTGDSTGNIYLTGETSSSSLLPGSTQTVRASRIVWVAKLNSSGTQLLYLVYIGGSGNDTGQGIAVDPLGNAYVTGTTNSTDFPTTSGAFSTQSAGPQEAFIAKFGPTGQVQYSTYLGGGSDAGFAIAVDNTGAVYVAGQTASISFPVTAGTIQTSYQGGVSDCFISKLSAAGDSLLYSTYLGGSLLDLCTGIAIDASSDVYVTGTTYSTNFPVQTALQSNLMGSASAFVAEINPSASALLYSTYLGGSVVDNGNAIVVDSLGSAYIAGSTSSPDFPTTSGAAQTVLGGLYNAFIAKLTPGGTGLTYSTLIGGSGTDSATAIAIDTSGQAVAGGFTNSPNFPVANAIQPAFGGIRDAFATVVSASGSSLLFSTYFGGSADDRAFAIAALAGYSFALGGITASTNFPTTAALQSSFGGEYDGFLLNAQYEDGQAYYLVASCQIADTRVGSGFSGAFGPPFLSTGSPRSFPVPASSCDVPPSAQAYSLNVTAVPHGELGYLAAWPTDSSAPLVATTNSVNGRIVGNAAIVSAGTNGSISLLASNDTDVVISINGYFAPPTAPQALAFYPIAPCPDFPIQSSSCDIPSSAQAYSLRMTAGASGASGGLVGNEAIVSAGANGPNDVFATDLVIDITGYFAPPGNPGALYFYPLTHCVGGASHDFPVLSSSCGIPPSPPGYSFNLTVVPPGPMGFLTVSPFGQPFLAIDLDGYFAR
jgi:hypothetical protein